jgi:quercetin dioxygenase-like cupin family protein
VLKGWRWSEAWRPISHADTIYVVLEGALMLNNPATGEAHRVLPGEAVYFLRNTWYFGLSAGDMPLKILEYIGPEPPASAVPPHTNPPVESARFFQDEWLGRWPTAQEEARQGHTLRVVRDADCLWRLEGQGGTLPVALFMSTPHLTAGKVRLLPGQLSDIHNHGGDEALYLPAGQLKVRLADHQGPQWSHLEPGDGFYIPQGAPHQYYNSTATPVEFFFGVAPSYLLEP